MPTATLLDLTPGHRPVSVTIRAGQPLHVGKAPGEDGHVAADCGSDHYLTLTSHEDQRVLIVECHSANLGAWVFELAEAATSDARARLSGLSFDDLETSLLMTDVGAERDESIRWIRAARSLHEVSSREGDFTFFTARDEPHEVRRSALVFLPGGHVYELEAPVRRKLPTAPRSTSPPQAAPSVSFNGAGLSLERLIEKLSEEADDRTAALIEHSTGRVIAGELPPDSTWLAPATRLGSGCLFDDAKKLVQWACAQTQHVPVVLRDLRRDGNHSKGATPHALAVCAHPTHGRVAFLYPLHGAKVPSDDDLVGWLGLAPPSAPRTKPTTPGVASDPVARAVSRWFRGSATTDFARACDLYDAVVDELTREGMTASLDFYRALFSAAFLAPSPVLGRLAAVLMLTPLIDATEPEELSVEMIDCVVAAELHLLGPAGLPGARAAAEGWLSGRFRQSVATFRRDRTFGKAETEALEKLANEFDANPISTFSTVAKNHRGRHEALRAHAIVVALLARTDEDEGGCALRLSDGLGITLTTPAKEDFNKRLDAGLFGDEATNKQFARLLDAGHLAAVLKRYRDASDPAFTSRCASALERLSHKTRPAPERLVRMLRQANVQTVAAAG